MPRRHGRTLRLGATALGLVLAGGTLLAGCGDQEAQDSPAPAAKTAANGDVYNAADVDFAQGMIPHHADAVTMVDLLRKRKGVGPQTRQLATRIGDTQTPQIQTMTTWLTDWDEKVPATSRDHANGGHSDSGHEMGSEPGDQMATDEQSLAALKKARGKAFETRWLNAMAAHHRDAVEMANTEIAEGTYKPAIAMATRIRNTQEREIEQIEKLLERGRRSST